jgi:hypothetical protein
MIPWALLFAFAKAGKSIPARIAMIAMTTSNSISVKADRLFATEFNIRLALLEVREPEKSAA